MRRFYSFPQYAGALVFASTLMLLIGCNSGAPTAANHVKGKITVNGTPVANGSIEFHGDKDKKGSAITGGVYQIDNPPMGSVKVTVTVLGGAALVAKDKEIPGMMKDKGPGVLAGGGQGAVPNKKYASPDSSDLTYEVKAGKHNKDFDLEP